MNVTKRDGSLQEFDITRIQKALAAAFADCDYDIDLKTIEDIASEVSIWDEMSIEDIQDQVVELLDDWDFHDVAESYAMYRKEHALLRAKKDRVIADIKVKLEASNIENQNANVDEQSFGGRKGEAMNVVTKEYALNYIVSSMARENHENNLIYIHDLDAYAVGMHNCLTVPFDDLLAKGFNTRQTDVRPANSVNTAFQLIAVIFQLQSLQQFGGVSASHLDWTMVPYVRKSFYKHYKDGMEYIEHRDLDYEFTPDSPIDWEDYKICSPSVYEYALAMTKRECHQAVEGMYHNLNTLQSRSGNQLPFTSVNYGTCTLPEGRMVTQALLEVSIEGIGAKRRTPIFPCGIFQIMKGVNKEPGTPNYDLKQLALKSTSQRLYPNYANVDWSGNAGYDKNDPKTYFSTMGK